MPEVDGFLFLQDLDLILTDFLIDFAELIRQLDLERGVVDVDTQGVCAQLALEDERATTALAHFIKCILLYNQRADATRIGLMTGMREVTQENDYVQKGRYIFQRYNNKYWVMSEKQARDQAATFVQFQLPLEKPSAEIKKPKKGVSKEKETARKIILKTIDQLKQVKVLYNDRIGSLKIKYEPFKVVYSYLEFPQKIKEFYHNTYQLYDSLKGKNKKILFDQDTKCLIFSDKRKPKPNKPASQLQQIIDDEAYGRSLSCGVIFELEQSTQILSLIRGSKRSLLAQHYQTLGKEYLRQCFYNRAKQNFDKALEICGQLHPGRTEQCAKIHYELGRLYIRQGEKVDQKVQEKNAFLKEYQQRAIEEFKSALEILSFIKDPNLAETKANILNSLGSAYSRLNPQQAKKRFLEALSQTQRLDKSSNPCFEAYLNLGKLHNRLKDYTQAYKYISQYQRMINLGRFDKRKTFKLDCQLQYACLGLKRYQQGLKIITKMDRSQSTTIDTILSKWSKAFANINDNQFIEPMQTLLNLLRQNCDLEIQMNDPRIRATSGKLQLMKGE